MTDIERLVQRFVDQDLSADERIEFVARLGRDEAMRMQVIGLEQVVRAASSLPKPAVPPVFVANVLGRLEPRRQPHHGLAALFWKPHTLRWNFANALAAACLAVVALGGAALAGRWFPVVPASSGSAAAVGQGKPAVVHVRLVIVQPGATTVQVAGDFNGWNPSRTSLERVSNDAWGVTIALEPGRYAYAFLIDGRTWVADPFAAERNDDGFGAENSVIDVMDANVL